MKEPSGLIRGAPSGPSGIKCGGMVLTEEEEEEEEEKEEETGPGLLNAGWPRVFFRLK